MSSIVYANPDASWAYPDAATRRAALKTQDYTGNYGKAIPLSHGLRRISGVPIWMGPLTEGAVVATYEGTPQIAVTSKSLNRSFAIALGYNLAPLDEIDLPKVRRVWVDGVLVYANGSTVQPIWYDPVAGAYTASINKVPTYDQSYGLAGAPESIVPVTLSLQTTINFDFYAGTEEQTPNAIIAADKGALTPAYRGMIYMVIKDFPVGLNTQTTMAGVYDDIGTNRWGHDRDVMFTNGLPKIDVEMVDGTHVLNASQDFELLAEATAFPTTDNVIMTNWKSRQIAVMDPADNVQLYDMDAKVQTKVIPLIKTNPNATFGNSHNFTDWDTINGVLYSYIKSPGGGTEYPIGSVDLATGQMYGSPYDNFFNLGFYDSDGADSLVSGKPAITIPEMWIGAIGHYIFNGQVCTALYGTGFDPVGFLLMPSNNGQSWPPSVPVTAMHEFDQVFYTCQALPLVEVALENELPSYQDLAFVVSYGSKVAIVYAAVTYINGYNQGKIVGVEEIYSAPDAGMRASAFVMTDRDILILAYKALSSETDRVARVNITYDKNPNYALAPGWKGYFPHASEVVYEVECSRSLNPPGSDMLKFSNTANGVLFYQNDVLISTADGASTFVLASGLGVNGDDFVWDDVTKTVYGTGTVNGIRNMRYQEQRPGITGDVGLLRNYLKWFGLRAGYPEAKISVDSKITDQVVGSIVVTSLDMAKLFNDLGKLYGFLWFVSAGVLRFVKNNQAPIKATSTLTITGQPSDGNTVTIGSYVYTFKLIPAAPYDVKIDSTLKETTLINLMRAINKSGRDGYEYFSITAAHTDVVASCPTDTTLLVTARAGGSTGNSITSTETSTALSWSSATLTGGDAAPTASINLTTENMMCVQGGPVGEGAALVTTFPSAQDTMEAAQIGFYNLDADYMPSIQTFAPDDGSDASGLRSIETYETTFVMSNAEAYGRVTKLAVTAAGTEVIQEFQLSQQFLRVEPSDIASVTIGPYNYIIRLDEVTFNGDYTISVTGQNYSFRDDIPVNNYAPASRQEQSVQGPGDGFAVAIDGPLIDPLLGSTAGVFNVYSGVKTYGQVGWRSAQMKYQDSTQTISPLYTAALDVPYGTAGTVLATTDTPFLTDNTTVFRVVSKTIDASDLASATAEQFYNNENLLIVGKPGRWEYVAFRTVTAVNAKVFEFTGLARGRRGTDANVGTHEANDEVYLVKSVAAGFLSGLQLQAQGAALVGEEGEYTVLGIPATRATVAVVVTFSGESLKPFSPCNLAAVLQVGNDIDLTWNRRDRLATDFITDEPPLSETSELYDLEILASGVVVRTQNGLTTPTYTYASADQTTDGFSPPLASLEVRVYQRGELGRGYPKQETINVE